jgi:CBS domain-containing protein
LLRWKGIDEEEVSGMSITEDLRAAVHPSTPDATVSAVMTRCPISVPADAPLRTVTQVLAGSRVGAVPVVDRTGAPIGVVSEIDLIRAGLDQDLDRRTARDVMTGPVVSVAADEPLPVAARRLTEAGVRRLFVVEDGRLTGVLSRRDLLAGYLRSDDEIHAGVERGVRALLSGRELVTVEVRDGVVLLLGRVGWRSELGALGAAAAAVPGVVEVRNRVGYFWDDMPGGRSAR